MEYFDVLDENGNKTGKLKLRNEVHRDGDWHRGVHVWIINSFGELLLQRRSPNKENDIMFVCYQALKRNNIACANYSFLVEMAEKYNKTQNQILLNWLIKEKGLNTIIKTNTIKNIDSNLASQNFTLEKEDVEILNNFQDERFNNIEIDWENNGGITIDKLTSQFKVE